MAETKVAKVEEEKVVPGKTIALELEDNMYARFMRTFDLSSVKDVGPDPVDRVRRVVLVHIGQWELQEAERHGKERLAEEMQMVLQAKKEELGI